MPQNRETLNYSKWTANNWVEIVNNWIEIANNWVKLPTVKLHFISYKHEQAQLRAVVDRLDRLNSMSE